MIVDKFKLRSEVYGDVAIFDFNNINQDTPYILTGATGLSADNVFQSNYTQNRYGIELYSMSIESREIALKISLNPTYSSSGEKEDLRDNLYRAIYSSYIPSLWFDVYNGSTFVATINGIVTKMESSLFTSKPEIDIILKCYDPFFRSTTRTTIPTQAYSAGILTHTYSQGTAPVGFEAEFSLSSDASYFSLDYDADSAFRIEFDFLAGDTIRIVTTDNTRDVIIPRSASNRPEPIRIANSITSYSAWPVLFPGLNQITVTTSNRTSGLSFLGGSYYKSYWGI